MKTIQLKSLELKPTLLGPRSKGGKLGITNINIIVAILVTFVVDILAAVKEKDYFTMLRIIPALLAQGNIIAVAGEAWAEIKDTDVEESNDIHLQFKDVLDLKDDETEVLVEDAFGLVPKAYGIIVNSLTIVASAKELYEEARSIFSGNSNKSVRIAGKAKTINLEPGVTLTWPK